MSEASISDVNPYDAPDASLDTGQDELYQPKIFSFNGRIGRMRYLAYSIGVNFLLMLVMMPLAGLSAFMGGDPTSSMVGMLGIGIFYVVTIVISVMFAKRRLNDLNRSGWWFLLFIIPIVNLLLAIYLIFFPGNSGNNNFGAAPAANTIGVLILGWMFPALMILGIVAAVVIPQFAGMAPQ
ncbi:MAG: DUF805 domain-containing protein [Gammaproteobacteria bacterium]|nr:DUF805 domain-containing protein [Gammaproteobacteria bacterium]MBT8436718.1 DUF805 domain-containing protein [Gammaproteobacteria bacterium]